MLRDVPTVSSLRQVDHLVIHVFHIAEVQEIWDVQVHSLTLRGVRVLCLRVNLSNEIQCY